MALQRRSVLVEKSSENSRAFKHLCSTKFNNTKKNRAYAAEKSRTFEQGFSLLSKADRYRVNSIPKETSDAISSIGGRWERDLAYKVI